MFDYFYICVSLSIYMCMYIKYILMYVCMYVFSLEFNSIRKRPYILVMYIIVTIWTNLFHWMQNKRRIISSV